MASNGISLHWPSMTKGQILQHPGQSIVGLFRGWHKARGWRDIGYHFVLNRDNEGKSRLYPGRNIWSAGAHSGTSYGNSFIGLNVAYGTDESIPEEMFDQLAKEIAKLSDRFKFKISEKTVRPHRDFVPTDCPGDSLINRLPELRNRAESYTRDNYKAKTEPEETVDENIGKINVLLNGDPGEGVRINSQTFLNSDHIRNLGIHVDYDKETDTAVFVNTYMPEYQPVADTDD